MKKRIKIIAIIAGIAIFIGGVGLYTHNYFVDRQLERIHEYAKPKGPNGIIEGEGSFEEKNGSDTALIIIHGFTSSPSRFYRLRNMLSSHAKILPLDVFIPLLPYHGRSLQEFNAFDHLKIREYVEKFLEEKRRAYKKIVLVGESYGTLVILDLLNEKPHLKLEKLIFSAPGLYLNANTSTNRKALAAFSVFMDYCTSPLLGCYKPYLVDEYTAKHALHAKKHGVVFITPTKKLFEVDNKVRNLFETLSIPHEVIVGEGDKVIGVKKLLSSCHRNAKYCSERIYKGGHLTHWGPDSDKYEDHILKSIQSLNPKDEKPRQ